MKNIISIIIALFALNIFLGFYKLGSIPPGQAYDEIIYVSEARVLQNHGTDMSGKWRPWHLAPSDGMYTELTSTTIIPGLFFFKNNPWFANKFGPVLMACLIPILLGLIIYQFTKNKTHLVVVGILVSFNPWIFQLSRTGFDALFSIVFYLLGITFLLYFKEWKKLLSIIPFFWGFYQYQGYKVLLVPIVGWCLMFLLYEQGFKSLKKLQKNEFKQLIPILLVMVFSILLTLNYLFSMNGLSTSVRSQEITIADSDFISSQVNEARRLSLQSPFVHIFQNKFIVLFRVMFGRFLNTFDPIILFLEGNKKVDTFFVLTYGYFHKIDLLLILIFFVSFNKLNKKYSGLGLFIAGITIIGAIPNIIRNGDLWIIFRGGFSFIGLVLMSGVALAELVNGKKRIVQILLLFSYILLITSFLHNYFFEFPISNSLNTGFSERVVANYVKRQPDQHFVLIADRSDATYDYFLSYNQPPELYSSMALKSASSSRIRSVYENRVFIIEFCPVDWSQYLNDPDTTLIIDIRKLPCSPPDQWISNINTDGSEGQIIEIKSLVDTGTRFLIINDKLCNQYLLQSYPHLLNNHLHVEKLNDRVFCEDFFSTH